MSETPKNEDGERPADKQPPPAEDRRKPRSSFVERIGKARGRRRSDKKDDPRAR
jgi:hypothetical protein